jgi:RND family efflux transporter MFP subunit
MRVQSGMTAAVAIFLGVLTALVVVLFVIGLVPRLERASELKRMHEQTAGAVPVVHTIVAEPAPQTESVTLPGNIGAILYTTIYARVDGYLKSRLVDIGDQVKKGQLLAVIDTPTVDQALEQAKADYLKAKADLETSRAKLKQAEASLVSAQADVDKGKANNDYATVTATRWINLCARGAVSQQSRDEKVRSQEATLAQLKVYQANEKAAGEAVRAARSEVNQAAANVQAKLADVRRLEAEQSFQKVTAPFDGIITLRKVDPGALITQGSMSSNLELFQMAQIDRLRIYVSAPQRIARYLRAGMDAQILVPEFPERSFVGKVTNVSGALDPDTRTRQTEIQIDNKDHALLPGMYAEIRLSTLREQPWIRVPGTTLVTRTDGVFVVVVSDNKVHYQPITIGRDFGDEVEVRTGLEGGEKVVVSPNDDLREGEPVKVVPVQKQT